MTTKQIIEALKWAETQALEWRGAFTHNPDIIEYDDNLKLLKLAIYHTELRLSSEAEPPAQRKFRKQDYKRNS